jgi:hypothetical protein
MFRRIREGVVAIKNSASDEERKSCIILIRC